MKAHKCGHGYWLNVIQVFIILGSYLTESTASYFQCCVLRCYWLNKPPNAIGCSLCNTINLQYNVAVSNAKRKGADKEFVFISTVISFNYFPVQFTILGNVRFTVSTSIIAEPFQISWRIMILYSRLKHDRKISYCLTL